MERGYLFAIGAAVTWGLMYAIEGKILSKNSLISPIILLFAHSLLMTLITLPFFLREKGLEVVAKEHSMIPLIILAVLLGTVANLWIFSSIQTLGASTASMFEISYPLFVVIFCALLFGARVNLATIGGGILIGLGTLIVIRYG